MHVCHSVNGWLDKLLLYFQADVVKIGILHDQIVRLLRKLMSKFVKVAVIYKMKMITNVKYTDRCNQHGDDLLAVGTTARTFIAEMEDDITSFSKNIFFRYIF